MTYDTIQALSDFSRCFSVPLGSAALPSKKEDRYSGLMGQASVMVVMCGVMGS
jgi:hypothetical protein